jgi:hypothetical protein
MAGSRPVWEYHSQTGFGVAPDGSRSTPGGGVAEGELVAVAAGTAHGGGPLRWRGPTQHPV